MLSNEIITNIVYKALNEAVENPMSVAQKQQLVIELTKQLLAEELQKSEKDSFIKLVPECSSIVPEISSTANLTVLPLKQCSVQHRSLLTKVFQFIEANYRNPIGLKEVAKEVNLSPAYITDLVRRETGQTVLNWILQRRIAEARCLLIESDHSVTEIAQTLGYENPGHFIRLFRRFNGTTPKAWKICQIDNT
ncbi:helix-turn-helix domain-containing protein [Nostoc sp.]|uniref:helix-turn-helix domain-containing protein n=1 Tax=Nostoc sp. TaxID=1180 RepID=UPI003593C8CC